MYGIGLATHNFRKKTKNRHVKKRTTKGKQLQQKGGSQGVENMCGGGATMTKLGPQFAQVYPCKGNL